MKILTAIITPFNKKGHIDYKCLYHLIDQQISNHSDGIVIAGTTGEGMLLTNSERDNLFKKIASKYSDLIPYYFCIGGLSTQSVLKEINKYDYLKPTGYLITVPYFILPTDEGIITHFKTVAKATERQILIYNIPKRCGKGLSINTIRELANINNITGIKDATGNIEHLNKLLKISNIDLYLGNDELFFWGFAKKVEGIISVISNVALKEMHDPISNKAHLEAIIKLVQVYPNPIGIKKYLRNEGINVGTVRLPLLE